METILITSKNKSDIDLLRKLVEKMGLSFISLNDEEREDIAMLRALLEADRTQKVSKSTILKKIEEKCK
ncbi:MAG: hypothetical protein M0Q51_17005 [Bacteroidales bacterium]|nr:hypothetical protein [Bacteroidales bacterium]